MCCFASSQPHAGFLPLSRVSEGLPDPPGGKE
jgi:hypothetical protein